MALATGARLGPYEIVSPLGAGGMGEVYRAKDERLQRDVAVKVLPSELAVDERALRRFEQEARAAGVLNHPNIMAVHDVGRHDGTPYVVCELLEGDTLAERLHGGALPARKAVDYALQAAQGLAAAHDKGIVHRDLKPANLFVTKDGRLKILDFGLAKLTAPEPQPGAAEASQAPTVEKRTHPGVIMGTVGYMAPEQVRGRNADARADIFSLGVVLYEMLTGQRAFRRDSAVEVLNAILKSDPPDMAQCNPQLAPSYERVVRHCLEKSPDERFQSARDLAFDLRTLLDTSGQSVTGVGAVATRPRFLSSRAALAVVALAVGAGLMLALDRTGVLGAKRTPPAVARPAAVEPPTFRRLTFRRGSVSAARFAPDGRTVIYDARWSGEPSGIYATDVGSPESRTLGPGTVLAVSRVGELLVLVPPMVDLGFVSQGTLARAPFSGGAPREVLTDVTQADWSPDGSRIAVLHTVNGKGRIEYPIGTVMYEANGWCSHLRVSPDGRELAFIEHPISGDDGGNVCLIDASGKRTTLSEGWRSAWGLAWSQGGDAVWFTATRAGVGRAVWAVDRAGRQRTVLGIGGGLTLHDISPAGTLIVAEETGRSVIMALPPGESREREVSLYDYGSAEALSRDGRRLLIIEAGEAGGERYRVYLRGTDGSPAVLLGEGAPQSFSPDEQMVASVLLTSPPRIALIPTGAGQQRELALGDLEKCYFVQWLPDGRRLLFVGLQHGNAARMYTMPVGGGSPQPFGPEGVRACRVTPAGDRVILRLWDGRWFLCPIDGGETQALAGLPPTGYPIQWSDDGRSLYVAVLGERPSKVYRYDVGAQRLELWKEFTPPDPAGVKSINRPVMTPDAKTYAYDYVSELSDLYLVDGVKQAAEGSRHGSRFCLVA